jgi:hypothetical protein
MCLLSWRSWKLKRKAIGSNDAEVQSIVEAEDQNFRVRLLWSELHGAGALRPARRVDLVEMAEEQALTTKGILCTDSKGGYDAVEVNESPLLGLSNMRAALQAFQLRDNLQRVGCNLRWLASDYDLADAMTKKRMDSRIGLTKFLKTWPWSIAYDPNFVAAKKNRKIGKTAVQKVDDALGENFSPLREDPVISHHNLADLAISAADVFLQKLQRELAINAGAEPEHLHDLAINAGEVPEQALQPDLAIIARDLYLRTSMR